MDNGGMTREQARDWDDKIIRDRIDSATEEIERLRKLSSLKMFKVYFDSTCILLQCESRDSIMDLLVEYDDGFVTDRSGEIHYVYGDYDQVVSIEEVKPANQILLVDVHWHG